MAKPNYTFDKRQRELKKARKQEEKRLRKLARNPAAPDVRDPSTSTEQLQ